MYDANIHCIRLMYYLLFFIIHLVVMVLISTKVVPYCSVEKIINLMSLYAGSGNASYKQL